MNYYIQKPDELYHYGVKGMRWGHRKAHESNSNGHKRMSTAKKVAIGVGVAAAVGVTAYAAVKSRKILINSLSARYIKTGKKLVEQSHFEHKLASETANMADIAKLRGQSWRQEYHMRSATEMRNAANRHRDEGLNLISKGKSRSFTNKDLLGEAKNLRKDIKNDYWNSVKTNRIMSNMYTDDGQPNFTRQTMRKYERNARRNAGRYVRSKYKKYLTP